MPERETFDARVFGRLLSLLPGPLRRAHGDEMRATFAARRADARRRGRAALVGLWVREGAGLLATAARARRRPASGPRSPGASTLDSLAQDVRFVARSLGRSPGFTATALLVVAVGVGASTAIFSAVNAVLLRPLPFADPDRLVMVWEHNPEKGWWMENAAPANVLDWRERVDAFEDVAFYDSFASGLTVAGEEGAERLTYALVSGNFFDVLGVRTALGESFAWDDTWEGGDAGVVLAWDTWRTRFGADPGVVGRTVELGEREVTVRGVMPEGFRFPRADTEMWASYRWPRANREQTWFRRAHWVSAVARLRPGVGAEAAAGQLDNVAAALEREYPETNARMGAGLTPLHDFLVGDRRTPLLVLLGAVGLLLVLACADVANLLLVRAQGRGRELAVRRAMGAGGGRLARLVLLESALLAGVGGALGFGLGVGGVRLLDGMRSLTLPGLAGLAVDPRVAGFAVAVVALAALLFGLPPALHARAAEPSDALREGGRGGLGRRSLRVTRALVVAEVALSVLLVAGAGLMVRSFLRLRAVDPGVRVEDVMTFRVVAPGTRYASGDEVVAFFRGLDARLEALPGVEGAALVRQLVGRPSWSSDFSDRSWPPERVGREILHREVSPDYFAVMDVPLLAGRTFTEGDAADSELVVVVNDAFVAEHYPGEDVVGRMIAFDAVPDSTSAWRRIVGVVGSERQESPWLPARAEVFAPLYQDVTRGVSVVLRTRGEPTAVMPGARAALAELDPLLPATEARTMEQVLAETLARDRFLLVLVGVFGAAALILAAVGVYGVVAEATRRRTREIGIRMALGAGAGTVGGLVLRQGMGLVVAGLALGLVGALAGAGLLRSLLYEVAPHDPVTLATVPALLAAVALVACWLPARRAMRVDPVRSLRAE